MFTPHMLITLATLAGTAIFLITNIVRSEIVALLIVFILMVSGVLGVHEALSGFANPVVIIIASMFIISEAIVHTGIAQRIGEAIIDHGGTRESVLMILLMLASAFVGAFMSSTATAAIFIPITLAVSEKAGINHKRLLMPLAVASLISGMMTLVATAPNIAINNVLQEKDLEPLSFFSFTPFGIVILLFAVLFMVFFGRNMLSARKELQTQKNSRSVDDLIRHYEIAQNISLLRVTPDSSLINLSVARIQLGKKFQVILLALQTSTHNKSEVVPASPERIFHSGDILVLVGTPQQIDLVAQTFQLKEFLRPYDLGLKKQFLQVVGMAEVMLTPESNLIGSSIKDYRFQSQFNCMVMGIRRKGTTITTDIADIPLKFGDVLLICGSWTDILHLRKHRDQYLLLSLPQDYHEVIPAQNKAPITIALLIAMVGLMVFNVLPNVTIVLGTAIALVLTRCINQDSWHKVIDWKTVILIAGILPLALALEKTGVSNLMGDKLLILFNNSSQLIILGGLFLLTAIIGLFMSNTPTAVLVAPIAIGVGMKLGISPQACAMTVAIASSAAFASPLGSPVNMIVMEPGGYKLSHYAKVGTPLLLLSLAATLLLAWVLYLR